MVSAVLAEPDKFRDLYRFTYRVSDHDDGMTMALVMMKTRILSRRVRVCSYVLQEFHSLKCVSRVDCVELHELPSFLGCNNLK